MTLTLPDDPALAGLSLGEVLLDLACGSYAAGRVSRGVGARMAGVSQASFDEELFRRRISVFDEDRLEEDLDTIRTLKAL